MIAIQPPCRRIFEANDQYYTTSYAPSDRETSVPSPCLISALVSPTLAYISSTNAFFAASKFLDYI